MKFVTTNVSSLVESGVAPTIDEVLFPYKITVEYKTWLFGKLIRKVFLATYPEYGLYGQFIDTETGKLITHYDFTDDPHAIQWHDRLQNIIREHHGSLMNKERLEQLKHTLEYVLSDGK